MIKGRARADAADSDRASSRAALATTVTVAVATFAIAYDNGAYSLTARSALAISVWWAILLGVVLRVLPLGRPVGAAAAPGLLLAAFAGWDLLSVAWSESAENAFVEFDRTSLYLGIYTLVVLTSTAGLLASWISGATIGIGSTGLIALVSRFFPGSFPGRGLAALLPAAASRLSFPLGYWNGLGIFLGLGFPLLVHSAVTQLRLRRMAAVAALPALGVAVYLTSSRGAILAAAAGTLVVALAHPRRACALTASLAGGVGAAVAIGAVASRQAIVDGPFDSASARAEGREAAVAVLLVCLATAFGHEWLASWVQRAGRPRRRVRLAALFAVLAVVVGGVAAAAHSFESFTSLPTATGAPGTVGTHLLSGSGSGRWQFWTAALDEFKHSPLQGGGAGSFQAWWARDGSFPYFVRDAHSLFAETLAELGIVGLILLVATLVTALVTAVRRLRATAGEQRAAIAALLGGITVFLLGAAVDWMWELTAVTAVGIAFIALLTGPASATGAAPARRHRLATLAVAGMAGAMIIAESIALLSAVAIGKSEADARAGRPGDARAAAQAATRIEPWAATPYLQLSLVEQSQGDFSAALRAIDSSLSRDRGNWQLWLVRSKVENSLGDFEAGRTSLIRARTLSRSLPAS